MTTIQEIETVVSSLPPKKLAEFRAWFEEFDAAAWDKQFEIDAASGKLNEIAEKGIRDYKKGNFREL